MALLEDVNVIVEPEGARSGTLSHVAAAAAAAKTSTSPVMRPRSPVDTKRVIIKTLSILIS